MKIISLDMYLTLAIAAVALFVGLIIMQNIIAVGMSKILNVDPLVGMCTGSISMVGGHGVASAFNNFLYK